MIWPAFCAASSTVSIAFKPADIKLVRELWGLFSEVREKSVVGFRTYLHFFRKNEVLNICRYLKGFYTFKEKKNTNQTHNQHAYK